MKRLGIAKMEPVKYITLTITKYLLKVEAPTMDKHAEIVAIDSWTWIMAWFKLDPNPNTMKFPTMLSWQSTITARRTSQHPPQHEWRSGACLTIVHVERYVRCTHCNTIHLAVHVIRYAMKILAKSRCNLQVRDWWKTISIQ